MKYILVKLNQKDFDEICFKSMYSESETLKDSLINAKEVKA